MFQKLLNVCNQVINDKTKNIEEFVKELGDQNRLVNNDNVVQILMETIFESPLEYRIFEHIKNVRISMLIVFKRKAMTNEKFAESKPLNVIEYSESFYRLFSIFSGVL